MIELRITPSVLSLNRTAAEKILLAYLCQRAAETEGTCTDTNKELAEAIGMHAQTISDLINRLGQTDLLQITISPNPANLRSLIPDTDLLADYYLPTNTPKPNAYPSLSHSLTPPLSQSLTPPKSKPDTPYPSITDTPLSQSLTLYPIRHQRPKREKRFCPITGIDITRQREDTRFVGKQTLERLFRKETAAFYALVDQILPSERLGLDPAFPSGACLRLAGRVRKLAREQGLIKA